MTAPPPLTWEMSSSFVALLSVGYVSGGEQSKQHGALLFDDDAGLGRLLEESINARCILLQIGVEGLQPQSPGLCFTKRTMSE